MKVDLPQLKFSEFGEKRCAELESEGWAAIKQTVACHFLFWVADLRNQDTEAIIEYSKAREKNEFAIQDMQGNSFTVTKEWFTDFHEMILTCEGVIEEAQNLSYPAY